MRKGLYGALAIAALFTACNKDINVKQVSPSPIAFDDAFVEIKTRAAADPSITTESINAFDVWGYMDNTSAVILNTERVTKGTDGVWSYQNLQYWAPEHTYYFYAVAPVDNANIVVDAQGATAYGLGTITFTNNGTDDLIYTSKTVTTGADVVNNDPGKVHLQFAHLLSKIKFTFTNGFPNENTKLVVKNITMKAPKKGVIDLTDGSWQTTNKWTVLENGAVLQFGNVNDGDKIEVKGSAECASECFTIPAAKENVNYEVKFTVELYHGTYDVPALTEEITTNITDQEFKIGKSYNFKATVSGSTLGLEPIEFEATVNPWSTESEKEIQPK